MVDEKGPKTTGTSPIARLLTFFLAAIFMAALAAAHKSFTSIVPAKVVYFEDNLTLYVIHLVEEV
jgi:hypothetical protein